MNYSKDSNKKKQQKLDSAANKVTKKVSTSFVKIILFGILALIIVGGGIGVGVFKAIIDAAPTIESVEDVMPKGYTTVIYDQNGNEVQRLHSTNGNRLYVELDQIPKNLQNAFISVEDERFWDHNGIDVKGIMRIIFVNIFEGKREGASTITQQLIRNNILSTEVTLERKVTEQYLAVKLEQKISKEKVLELYLNTISLGPDTNGVQTAAHLYFDKHVKDLTLAESAVIAGITQNPTKYNPIKKPENNREKQLIILNKMLEQNLITQVEHDAAVDEDVYANIQTINQNFTASSSYSYYVDEVIKRVIHDLQEKKGYTENQAENLIYSGGLSIYIPQDLKIQEIIDKEYKNDENFPPKSEDYSVKLIYRLSVETEDGDLKHPEKVKTFDTNEEAQKFIEQYKEEMVGENDKILKELPILIPQPQSAMVIMDYHTGHVKAIAGGRGEKVINRSFSRATEATRQPGSTFKVLAAFLPAIDTGGYTLGTVLDDVPTVFNGGAKNKYVPKNWYKGYAGLSTVRDAISMSRNIIAVKTLQDVGIQTGFDYLLNLGFTTLCDNEEIDGKIHSDKNLPLALGGITKGVSMLELTAAYGAIANNGVYIEPTFYTKVLNNDGTVLLEHEPVTKTVMKETTSFLLTQAMLEAVRTGTGTQARFSDMPTAGKTGTTQNSKDIVFVGYTPYYVSTIWMGYDEGKVLQYRDAYHKYLWKNIMGQVHEGLPNKDFEEPPGIVTARICSKSGKLAVPGLCDKALGGSTVYTEYFAKGTEPTEECDVHVKATICKESGLFANEFCPDSSKEERVYIVRPEPFVPEEWNPANPPYIADRKYELPQSMIGEYCNIHGPAPVIPDGDTNGGLFNSFINSINSSSDDNDDNDEESNNDNNSLLPNEFNSDE